VAPDINTAVPHPARIYDYFIGGQHHFPADRDTAAKILQRSPAVRVAARENRAFLGQRPGPCRRAVTWWPRT
jgi:S-adenosyl methyltransferase